MWAVMGTRWFRPLLAGLRCSFQCARSAEWDRLTHESVRQPQVQNYRAGSDSQAEILFLRVARNSRMLKTLVGAIGTKGKELQNVS